MPKITATQIGNSKNRGNATSDRLFMCLRSSEPNGVIIEIERERESSLRRLTEIECERLQGFPDNWTEGISSTQRYKCLGNAVTVKIVELIAKKLKETI